jgi:hypothetical protein
MNTIFGIALDPYRLSLIRSAPLPSPLPSGQRVAEA